MIIEQIIEFSKKQFYLDGRLVEGLDAEVLRNMLYSFEYVPEIYFEYQIGTEGTIYRSLVCCTEDSIYKGEICIKYEGRKGCWSTEPKVQTLEEAYNVFKKAALKIEDDFLNY